MMFFDAAALGLLGLIPLVVLLYFMKLRRPAVTVPAAFLWRQARRQARVDSFFEKLKVNRLLLLQIAVIVLLALALARPFVRVVGALPGAVVLVIDRSASMQATEGGATRLDRARRRARDLVQEARPGTRFMLISTTTRARVEVPFTDDRTAVLQALDALTPTDCGTDARAALELALASIRGREDAAVIVLGDAGTAAALRPGDAGRVRLERFDGRARNAAITAFQIRARGDGLEVFVEVANFSDTPLSGYLEIHADDGRLLDARSLKIGDTHRFPARKWVSLILPLKNVQKSGTPTFAGGISGCPRFLEARLAVGGDDLAADNRAWTVIPSVARPKVLLVTRGNPFLERVLELLPTYRVFRVDPAAYRPSAGYDATIWDGGWTAAAPPPGNALVLNAPGPTVKGPLALTAEARDDPVLRGADLGDVAVSALHALALPAAAQVLARAGAHPAIVRAETPAARTLLVAFDPLASNFPLSPSFPIFVANALAWLSGRGALAPPASVRAGDPIPLAFLGRHATVSVTTPEGRRETATGPSFGDTERAGVYRLAMGRHQWAVAANLLDADESNLAKPVSAPLAAAAPALPRAAAAPSARELWPALILTALAVLFLEWRLYHRGG